MLSVCTLPHLQRKKEALGAEREAESGGEWGIHQLTAEILLVALFYILYHVTEL